MYGSINVISPEISGQRQTGTLSNSINRFDSLILQVHTKFEGEKSCYSMSGGCKPDDGH